MMWLRRKLLPVPADPVKKRLWPCNTIEMHSCCSAERRGEEMSSSAKAACW